MGYRDESMREPWRLEIDDLPNALTGVWQVVQVDALDPGAGPEGADLPVRRSGHHDLPAVQEILPYDADGNLVSDAHWQYHWDGENRPIEMSTSAPALAAGVPRERYRYAYDARSRRTSRSVERWDVVVQAWDIEKSERFVYDEWNVVAVIDAAGAVLQRYVWGNDLSGTAQGVVGLAACLRRQTRRADAHGVTPTMGMGMFRRSWIWRIRRKWDAMTTTPLVGLWRLGGRETWRS